ncbi:uncharacterized protein METZ01_LOCUS1461, partial [marine metagenome]
VGHSPNGPHRVESALRETLLRPVVPFKSVQVDPFQIADGEHVVQQRGHGVVAISVAPVIPVADDDTQFGFAIDGVQIVVHTVADERAIQRLDGIMVGAGRWVLHLVFEQFQVPFEGHG